MRTFQLRRYELEPALASDFIDWVNQVIIPLREALGYRVEWKYFSESSSELIWLVSLEATEAEFEALDQRWLQSDARAKAFESIPKALIKTHIGFVKNV